MNHVSNPFETLGVSTRCTAEELRGAYRTLARRWHPDRFQEGPEREWANQHMTEINAAYAECCAMLKSGATAPDGVANLDSVYALIQGRRFSEARRLLLKSNTRGARWNYLFGVVLQKQGEAAKALTYLNLAARQAPENGQYRRARDTVQRLIARKRVNGILQTLHVKHK